MNDRVKKIIKEVERRLRWKREKSVSVDFYVTRKEEEILSRWYIIERDFQDRVNFKKRTKGRAVLLKM